MNEGEIIQKSPLEDSTYIHHIYLNILIAGLGCCVILLSAITTLFWIYVRRLKRKNKHSYTDSSGHSRILAYAEKHCQHNIIPNENSWSQSHSLDNSFVDINLEISSIIQASSGPINTVLKTHPDGTNNNASTEAMVECPKISTQL